MLPRSNYSAGRDFESAACELLRRKGFNIVERNYGGIRGTRVGEIDIIAFDPAARVLVFAEVKQRATHEIAGECVTAAQQERIAAGAQIFLDRNPIYAGADCRFDAILFDAEGRALHLENAFGI